MFANSMLTKHKFIKTLGTTITTTNFTQCYSLICVMCIRYRVTTINISMYCCYYVHKLRHLFKITSMIDVQFRFETDILTLVGLWLEDLAGGLVLELVVLAQEALAEAAAEHAPAVLPHACARATPTSRVIYTSLTTLMGGMIYTPKPSLISSNNKNYQFQLTGTEIDNFYRYLFSSLFHCVSILKSF